MKTATSFAREQRPVERYRHKTNGGRANPMKPKAPPKQKKVRVTQPDTTEGEWYSTGTAIINEKGEAIAFAAFSFSTNLPKRRRDMRMLANAKKLDALARALLKMFPQGHSDPRVAALLDQAKEAIGGANG